LHTLLNGVKSKFRVSQISKIEVAYISLFSCLVRAGMVLLVTIFLTHFLTTRLVMGLCLLIHRMRVRWWPVRP